MLQEISSVVTRLPEDASALTMEGSSSSAFSHSEFPYELHKVEKIRVMLHFSLLISASS